MITVVALSPLPTRTRAGYAVSGEGDRVAERDPEFEAMFHEVYPAALAAVTRFVSSRSAAEDLAAEAFARAFARWGHVRTLAWRDAWVMRVAINLAIDSTRARRPRLFAPPASRFEETAADRLALADAMGRLPRRQREVVALRYLADLSEHDVAEVLGISMGSVKTHLSRGLDRLREELGGDPAIDVVPRSDQPEETSS